MFVMSAAFLQPRYTAANAACTAYARGANDFKMSSRKVMTVPKYRPTFAFKWNQGSYATKWNRPRMLLFYNGLTALHF